MRGTPWKKLTRADLQGCFDDIGTKVILTAMDRGGTGRISNRGHATIRHPDGVRTMSVTRDSSSRKAKNMWGDLQRLFPEEPATTPTSAVNNKENSTMHEDLRRPPFTGIELPAATTGNDSLLTPVEGQLMPCPAKRCEREFATDGALYTHVRDDHATCSWPGCDLGPNGTVFVGDTANAVAGHTNIRHRGNKPWLNRDPSKRAESAQKAAATKAAKRAQSATPQPAPVSTTAPNGKVPSATTVAETRQRQDSARAAESERTVEHRGLPSGTVTHKPMSDRAKLNAIRDLLGEDPRIAKLQAENAELRAHLELVREAVGLDDPKRKK